MAQTRNTRLPSLGVPEVSVSEAAKRLQWHRSFVYGALEALGIHPQAARKNGGRVGAYLTAAEFKRLSDSVRGRGKGAERG